MRKLSKFILPIYLIVAGLIVGKYSVAATPAGSDTLRFIQITDPHVCNLTGYHQVFTRQRQHFGRNSETLSDFLSTVPEKYKADFVVVTGDNVDYYEAETTEGKMMDTQIEQYSRLLDMSEIPVYLTLGNHDITSYWVAHDSDYTNNQINAERARAAWMRNVPCFKEGTYYSRIFKIDTVVFRFIFLDNSYYATDEVADGVLPFVMDPYQLRWLNAELQTSPVDIELIFMHMPVPFAKASDKNIPAEQLSAYTVKTKYYDLLNVLDNNSSTRLIFAGHRHFNSINNFVLPDGDSLTQVMTGAFGYDPNAWRMIKITADKILISYPGSLKTEYTIPVRK
jgi:3',5'-cyclic AMP phosphodiesterase CpdA